MSGTQVVIINSQHNPVDAVFNSIKRSSMVNTEISPLKVLNLTLLSTKRMWWTNDKF